jgi:hypothetical protein
MAGVQYICLTIGLAAAAGALRSSYGMPGHAVVLAEREIFAEKYGSFGIRNCIQFLRPLPPARNAALQTK